MIRINLEDIDNTCADDKKRIVEGHVIDRILFPDLFYNTTELFGIYILGPLPAPLPSILTLTACARLIGI